MKSGKREVGSGNARKRLACFLVCAFFFLISHFSLLTSAHAQNFEYSAFRSIPILHEGRIKPLESFARIKLETMHGRAFFESKPAIAWLARTIFDPARAVSDQVFLVRNPGLKTQLDLDPDRNYFSLSDLQSGILQTREQALQLLAENAENLTAEQKSFLELHDRVEGYQQLLRSLSLILPLDITLPEQYRIDHENPAYLDLVLAETQAQQDLQAILERRGADPDAYSDQESQTAMLAFQLASIREGGAQNQLFKIMPAAWSDGRQDWLSPWQLVLSGQGSPAGKDYLELWQDLAMAYREGDAKSWSDASAAALDFILKNQKETLSSARLKAEGFYVDVKPYNWAIGFYLLFLIVSVIARSFASKPSRALLHRALHGFAMLSVTAGIIAHIGGIGFRMFILQRPPVGTLYESVLFVALIVALCGLILSVMRKQDLPLAMGAVAALALLTIAPVIEPDAENLDVLAAVLNTNFWLGTHVLVITAGYGICILAAMLAHGYLIRWIIYKERSAGLYNLTYKVSIAALLFTTLGTILGGIWADQSWGRFWGWDPKENGALLIVLWLIWAQHGRLSGHLNDLSFMAVIAFLNVIVALAWFGVNLLGTGLHSYGFTSGIANGLAVFCIVQTLIIAGLYSFIRRKIS